MAVDYKKENSELIISLSERLDMSNSIIISEKIEILLEDKEILKATFNLQGLNYISSAGLRIIINTCKIMSKRDGKISVVNYSDSIKKVLDITDIFQLCD